MKRSHKVMSRDTPHVHRAEEDSLRFSFGALWGIYPPLYPRPHATLDVQHQSEQFVLASKEHIVRITLNAEKAESQYKPGTVIYCKLECRVTEVDGRKIPQSEQDLKKTTRRSGREELDRVSALNAIEEALGHYDINRVGLRPVSEEFAQGRLQVLDLRNRVSL